MISNDFSMLRELVNDDYYDYDERVDRTVDAYFVVQLLKTSLTSNNYKDYEAFYNSAINYNKKNNLRDFILSGKRQYIDVEETIQEDSKEELFQELILKTLKKFPLGYDKNEPDISGMNYIYSFLNGNINAVTRDDNLRQRVSQNLSLSDIEAIIYNSGVLGNDAGDKLDNYIRMVVLNDIIHCMTIKWPDNVVANIEEFMLTNDCRYITSKVGKARNLARTFQGTEMQKFLTQLGVSGINEYIQRYYKNNSNSYERS